MGTVFKRDGKWAIDFTDHRGRRVRKVVASDKSVAMRILADETQAVEKMRAGILTADPREGRRPLQEHIDGYIQELTRRGRDSMYTYIVQRRLEAAAFDRDWECLRDCTAQSVGAYLKVLSDDGRNPRTVNQHRADLSAFFGWCVRQGYVPASPCVSVVKVTVKQEKTRRALSVAECQRLLAAAPEDRRAVYLFLLYTGLRRSEAASLCWSHIHLDVVNPYVELPACITKSGKAESVPLVPDVAAALRLLRGKGRQSVFEKVPSMYEFRKDLAAAGIPEEDERGRKVVLHSLRHSLATMLAQSKVPPAVAMKIMRHRDIRLTLEAYTDEGLLHTAAAMAGLPSLGVSAG
jgi:integrase